MAARKGIECPTWRPRSKLTSELQLHLCGSIFTLDKELLALKSAKIAKLLQKSPHDDLSLQLRDIPADQESMELVGRFCHGFEINLSTENVVRVACVAQYLGMTESHCPNNLINTALLFFEHHIIPSWNNSIKALKSAENVLQQAVQLGLVDYCVESIISKVLDDPRLLGEPIKNSISDDDSDENENAYRPNARRKLFDINWKSEDLSTLSLRLYAPIIQAMVQRNVPQEYVVANLCQYAKTWLFSNDKVGDDTPNYKRNSQREMVEALVKLLPNQRGIVPCKFLFEMLQFAVALDANAECKNGLETRIGKQLDQASVNDLLIPSQGYAKDEKYDTECVRRILKNFYCNYTGPDPCGLNSVAELIDEFLAEISVDIDLKISTFIALADMSVAASTGTQRSSDGLYRAIDIYLDKHRHLTESERDELCRVLDCNKLSDEACEHAAQNERLPIRVVVQVLFMSQLKLRESIPKEVQGPESRLLKVEEEEGDRKREEEVRAEIEKMGSKVWELERECHVMRREIERGSVRRQKMSMWKEMKRKLGCMTSMHDCNCHVKKKKVHPG
ncbi:BTB/POZ domain-containing protein At5g17580 isoform X2 [Sesamum indicum]|uniref:BTB/POZ domain-containing protein At5g17580 isoform X2 n=1 Tax=Sesamum indicum TaxID=4182 RepID=A0A8M8V9F3_SESIN|nr:BTB/POZ domain-containing protein At5g17580 isoform X2 [Sesamum indicum]